MAKTPEAVLGGTEQQWWDFDDLRKQQRGKGQPVEGRRSDIVAMTQVSAMGAQGKRKRDVLASRREACWEYDALTWAQWASAWPSSKTHRRQLIWECVTWSGLRESCCWGEPHGMRNVDSQTCTVMHTRLGGSLPTPCELKQQLGFEAIAMAPGRRSNSRQSPSIDLVALAAQYLSLLLCQFPKPASILFEQPPYPVETTTTNEHAQPQTLPQLASARPFTPSAFADQRLSRLASPTSIVPARPVTSWRSAGNGE
ncbi:hypothetical protein BKA66DRAFT_592150 [Pyrenochaeta sp. MPI-SDFR-AT-0127]|nr:hypothetical protein BKA66DRAFT_592150 [Pyrenochaeta sp. MPI-SDFR-AT-0127]